MTELAVHYAIEKIKLSEGHLAFLLSPRPCTAPITPAPPPYFFSFWDPSVFPVVNAEASLLRGEAILSVCSWRPHLPSQDPKAFSHHLSHLRCASSSSPCSLAPSTSTLEHALVSSTLKINVSKQNQISPTPHGSP